MAVLMKDGTLVFYYCHNKLSQLTGLNSCFSSVGQKTNMSLTKLKCRYQQAASFLDALGKNPFLCSFMLLEEFSSWEDQCLVSLWAVSWWLILTSQGHPYSLAPFLPLQSQQWWINTLSHFEKSLLPLCHIWLTLWPPFPLWRVYVITLAHLII